MIKTVCFTGHRKLPISKLEIIKSQLEIQIKDFINQGAEVFIDGGAIGFDLLAAECVINIKKIKLFLVLPCEDQSQQWKYEDIARYENIKSQADNIQYISRSYYKGCMLDRNKNMVDRSDAVIAYFNGNPHTGTSFTLKYAQGKSKKIVFVIA